MTTGLWISQYVPKHPCCHLELCTNTSTTLRYLDETSADTLQLLRTALDESDAERDVIKKNKNDTSAHVILWWISVCVSARACGM